MLPLDAECQLCSHLDACARDLDSVIERVDLLTPRERDVFDLLGPGLSSPEIAHALGVHPSTVKVHVRSILVKLETDRRTTGLIALIVHRGRCPQQASSKLVDTNLDDVEAR